MDNDDFFAFLIVFGYILLMYFITWKIRINTTTLGPYPQIIILSLTYTLLFGIGIYSSGGDPGFAFPCPLILATIFTIGKWFPNGLRHIYGILIPFAFWWILIFSIMFFKLKRKQKKGTIEK